ncbi:MAG: monovalent cation/H(+) antiporter subunit G [Microthrixaceae bacterium]
MTPIEIVAAVLLLAGCVLALLGALGVVRFPGLFARMHAATKPPTLGLVFVAAGVAVVAADLADAAFVALVVALQFLTAPVGAHLLVRAARRRAGDTAGDTAD